MFCLFSFPPLRAALLFTYPSLEIILLSFMWLWWVFFFEGVDARHQESYVQHMVAISPALNPDGMSVSAINALLYLCKVFIFLPSGAGKGATWISKHSSKVLKAQFEPLLWGCSWD